MPSRLAPTEIIDATKCWLERAVIGLNLCPFAKSVHVKDQIRYSVSMASAVDALAQDLTHELIMLRDGDPERLDTTLLIHPWVLEDFLAFNDFLGVAETLVEILGLEGEIQIASFHPQYQFADVPADDISNFTNRSPFPTLHLLRESSIDRAVAAFPDASEIFTRNIETMRCLGQQGWKDLRVDPTPDVAKRCEKWNRT